MNDRVVREGLLPIGKITGAHGIMGGLKIKSYADELSIFESGISLFVEKTRGTGKYYTVEWVKPHQRKALLAFEEIKDRTHAEELTGSEIYIEKALLPESEDGSFYWFEIIGLDVFSTDGTCLGCVESIIPTGSNDVYVVKNRGTGEEILVPAIKQVVLDIDIDGKKIKVDLPEGL